MPQTKLKLPKVLRDRLNAVGKSKYIRYLDRERKEIGFGDYMELASDDKYRTVGYDEVEYGGKRVAVSTVWLGMSQEGSLDSLWHKDDPRRPKPAIFETMVSAGSRNFFAKYSTDTQARRGHSDIVRAFKTGQGTHVTGEWMHDLCCDMLVALRGKRKRS